MFGEREEEEVEGGQGDELKVQSSGDAMEGGTRSALDWAVSLAMRRSTMAFLFQRAIDAPPRDG